MKSFIVCLFILAGAVICRSDKYTDKYDSIDLDEILSNRRVLVPYIKCILDEGKCTPDGRELKIHIRDALETECSKCTDIQKKGSDRVMGHLINNEPDYWKQLCEKYDPENVYASTYENRLRE